MRSFCTAKAPHIFSAKKSVFAYKTFKIFDVLLTNDVIITNDVISFEHAGPDIYKVIMFCYIFQPAIFVSFVKKEF